MFVSTTIALSSEADNTSGFGVLRQVDLSAATSATLTFVYGDDQLGGAVNLDVSADGGTNWTTLQTYHLDANIEDKIAIFDLTPFAAPNTQIRFIVIDDDDGEMGIDDIQIEYVIGATEGNEENSGGEEPVNNAATTLIVRDEFNTSSYSNNDGSEPWGSDWQEFGESNGPGAGEIEIDNESFCLEGLCLVVDSESGPNAGIFREVDLSNAELATLSFFYGIEPEGTGGVINLDVSSDGGATWTTLETFLLDLSISDQIATFDLTPYMATNTQLRFIVAGAYGELGIDNIQVEITPIADTVYPSLVNADQLHSNGLTGKGVTVAVIDTGIWLHPALKNDDDNENRLLVQYDAIQDSEDDDEDDDDDDNSGHGSHISSIIASSRKTKGGKYNGIAPNVNLISVKAFDDDGAGSYLDVIRGIDWIVANKDLYNIRVLNLSFSAPVQSYYWDDPINQAVMQAWEAGIVVVASAGNNGPDAMTIGVPGNVPYIITVGAMSDNYTPNNPTDDELASFSAAGPTIEGFVKPEIVAPGGHMWGLIPGWAKLALNHPSHKKLADYFSMSGTSQATAVTSGIVALMLEADPTLTPDDVKCRLMDSANPAVDENNNLAYSIFQQGAGLVNAQGATNSTAAGCANQGSILPMI